MGVERISGVRASVGVVDSDELELRPSSKWKTPNQQFDTSRSKQSFNRWEMRTGKSVDIDQQILWNGSAHSQVESQTFQPDFNDFTRRPFVRIEIATQERDSVKRFRTVKTKLFTKGSLIETKIPRSW